MEETSTFKVPYTKILEILPHPGADKLEFAVVYGWNVIVQKGRYVVGDEVFYIPIDSILNVELESRIFPADSKITLNNSRVRQIKIRGAVSQGMLLDPKEVCDLVSDPELEQDYAEVLGVSKYEPPAPKWAGNPPGTKKLRNKPRDNFHFRKYNGVQNIKWQPHAFREEEVVIQLKIHGSHIRWAKAPFVANTLWKKIKKFFGIVPKYESVYGSNNVDITSTREYSGFYGEDIYGDLLKKENAFDKIKDGEFWHGELYGPGVQKNYHYGKNEHCLVVFDVRIMKEDGTQKWLNPEEVEALAKERGFDFVPVLYRGPFDKELIEKFSTGPDIIYPDHPREGVVIKSRYFYDKEQNKNALKSINPDYLADKSNTDYH